MLGKEFITNRTGERQSDENIIRTESNKNKEEFSFFKIEDSQEFSRAYNK